MTIKLYNTLGREKQDFKPHNPDEVKIYLCGPTVYDLLHIGNFRGVIFFNLVRRWLEHLDYGVKFVLNFTDVDDKIINKAAENNEDALTLSKRYIEEYKADYARLQLSPHELNPKCTDHIDDMIQFISGLINKNHAYATDDGSVFFDIHSNKDYGKLSGKNIDDLEAGHRIEPDPRKKNPLDFVLWKPAKEGEPSWESPWGNGRPGWHIECSAMNHAIFGDCIDIHGGGIDLIFPHHENEIAQSESLTGHCFATYWMHNNFIRFGDEKMSKSLGNVIKARDFMDTYHPEILKFMILSVHYRSELNIDQNNSHQSISRLARIYHAIQMAQQYPSPQANQAHDAFEAVLTSASEKLTEGLNDDFNTPIAFASIFEVVREFNALTDSLKKKNPQLHSAAASFLKWINEKGKLLALFQEEPNTFLSTLDAILIKEKNIDIQEVDRLIEARNKARAEKDYEKSDQLRDALLKLDIQVQDGPDGTTWEVKKH